MTTTAIDAATALDRPARAAGTARVAWLFRHSLRAGEVHPALHLIQRYRSAPGALQIAVPAPPNVAAPCARAAIDAATLDRNLGELPALPQVVLELMSLLSDDGVNFADLASRIESDQALMARTLRLANSPFYGVAGRVGTIRAAIHLLGAAAVGSLVTTAALSSRFSGISCAGFDFRGFWKHGVATGIAARALARAARLDGDLAYAAGLLHDIGRLVLAARFSNELAAVIRCEHDTDDPPLDAERHVLGCDHADVGTRVANHWHFPAAVLDAIRQHHSPGDRSGAPSITDVVHVADALAHGLDLLSAPRECVPAVVPAAWSRLAIADDQFMSVLEQTEQGVTALCQALSL